MATPQLVNRRTVGDGWTALMVCAAGGRAPDSAAAVTALLARGADARIADHDGWTALHWCAAHDRPEAARAILSSSEAAGAEELCAKRNADGRTALAVAEAALRPGMRVAEVLREFEVRVGRMKLWVGPPVALPPACFVSLTPSISPRRKHASKPWY